MCMCTHTMSLSLSLASQQQDPGFVEKLVTQIIRNVQVSRCFTVHIYKYSIQTVNSSVSYM